LILGVWELLPGTGIVDESLLPSFTQVLSKWVELTASGDIPYHTGVSIWREFVGLGLSLIIGVGLGVGMAWSVHIKRFWEPLVMLTFPLPKSALIPILIVWFGIGHASKIAAIFLGCIVPVIISSFNGARGVDRFLIWSARNMGMREPAVVFRVVLPAALPDILSGVRIALALSFILLVSSELLIARAGLGYLISLLGEAGEYPGMFASIITVTMLGFFADRFFLVVMRRLLAWREAAL
jgi:NitT/TauT family transport system permease protein